VLARKAERSPAAAILGVLLKSIALTAMNRALAIEAAITARRIRFGAPSLKRSRTASALRTSVTLNNMVIKSRSRNGTEELAASAITRSRGVSGPVKPCGASMAKSITKIAKNAKLVRREAYPPSLCMLFIFISF